jgi:hypothetical protein
MTAIRLALVTAPMAKFDEPPRLNTSAMSGGWKPKISPTPTLLESTAASTTLRDAVGALKSGAGVAPTAPQSCGLDGGAAFGGVGIGTFSEL